jgi:hypothetical protein
MSRGGRRRRSKRSSRPSAAGVGSRPEAAGEVEVAADKPPGAIRARSQTIGRESSALETLTTPSGSLKTLPPDGLVLEELIANMQAEYGTPSTPQEYRLLIKVPTSEEAAVAPAADPGDELLSTDESPPGAPARTARRRRRGRRRSGSAPVTTDESEPDEEPAEHDEP